MLKASFVVILYFVNPSAFAISLSASTFSLSISYACLSRDGIPVSSNTEMASRCCGGGASASEPMCKAGFSSVPETANVEGLMLLHAATMDIQQAGSMMGMDLDPVQPLVSLESASGGSEGSAMMNAGNSADGMKGSPNSGYQSNSAGSGGQGAAGVSAGMGGGSLSASASSKKLASLGAGKGSGGMNEGGAYSSGAGSKNSGGSEDGAKSVGAGDGPNELSFGDSGSEQKGIVSNEDELSGSQDDSPDYLNRIDKSASIFKIVSKRYQKEIARNRVRLVEIK